MTYLKNIFRNSYFVDTRTLALFRIIFGFVGMLDVIRRFYLIDAFYSLEGINFRRKLLSNLSVKYFTLLDTFQTSLEVHLFFIFVIICFFCLIIGYRTKLFHFLSAIGLISIHNAAVILENGGDMVVNNFLIWSLFLPLGNSWSVDAIRKSLKQNLEVDTSHLNQPIDKPQFRYFHFAYLACLVQLAMIYFYNYVNKSGEMWSEGTAVYFMYQLETFLTPFGTWLQQYINLGFSKLLTSATMMIELSAPILILSPVFQPWLRRIIFILLFGLHLIIGVSIGIGLFSWTMLAVIILLLSTEDMNIFSRIIGKFSSKHYIVFYDRDCGFCHLTARIIKRMDIFNKLTWADRLYDGDKPENLIKKLETSLVVWNKDSNKIYIRHIGFSKIISILPFGFLFSWILTIPLIEKLFGFIYDKVSQNRTSISTSLGLSACGVPQNDNRIESTSKIISPLSIRYRNSLIFLSNVLVIILLIGAVDYSIQINEGVSPKKGLEKREDNKQNFKSTLNQIRLKAKHILLYPRMYQQWNMFSPSVIRNEKWMTGDIEFENGEKITLFTTSNKIDERFNRELFQPYQEQFWRKLFERINKTNFKKYVPDLKEWMKETNFFPEYKNRKVKNVILWHYSENSPGPESTRAPNIRKTEIVPGYNTNKSNRKKKTNKYKSGLQKKK